MKSNLEVKDTTNTLKTWEKPTIDALDVEDTANGMIGSDGNGDGSNGGGNSSGS